MKLMRQKSKKAKKGFMDHPAQRGDEILLLCYAINERHCNQRLRAIEVDSGITLFRFARHLFSFKFVLQTTHGHSAVHLGGQLP